jgi:hypothetical protein
MQEFLQHSIWDGKGVDGPGLSENSRFFQLTANVIYNDYRQSMTSILWRDPNSGSVVVLARSLGGF